jgi:DNA-binding beta-propeller fold protein YncE
MTTRMLRFGLRTVACATFFSVLGAAASTNDPKPVGLLFQAAMEIPLGPTVNRIDYETIDPLADKLYIAKMGAGAVLAVDLAANKVTAELPGLPKVTGVLVVPELHRLYASVPGAGIFPSVNVALGMVGLSSGSGAVSIIDTDDLHEVARLPGGVFPDGIAFDGKENRVFVSDELGSAVTVIDAGHDRLVGRIATGGEVGNVRYDARTGLVYAPIQSRNELVAIDPVKEEVIARHALPGADHPHGLILSPDAAIGYVACDGNDRLLTVDLSDGRVLSDLPVGHDPDVLAVDPSLHRLYVASESGNMSAFDIANAAKPVPLGDTFMGKDAHVVAVDPLTHLLYLPIADLHGRAVLRIVFPSDHVDAVAPGMAAAARPTFAPGWPGRN